MVGREAHRQWVLQGLGARFGRVACRLPAWHCAVLQAADAAVLTASNGLLIPPQPSLLDVFTGGGDRLPPPVSAFPVL